MFGIANLMFQNGHPMGLLTGMSNPVSLYALERGTALNVLSTYRGAKFGIVVETQDGGMGNSVTECHFKEQLSDAQALGVDTSKTRLNDQEIVYSPNRRVMAFSLERLFRDADDVTLATLRDPLVSKNYSEMTLVVHSMAAGLRLPTANELKSMGHLGRDLMFWTREHWFGHAGGGDLHGYSGPGSYVGTLGVACVGGAQDSK